MEADTGRSQPVVSPAGDVLVGMQIGAVHRLTLTEIPNNPGLEIFPTIEVIDRLYPPPGLALRHPIPIELTLEELELAARGSFVTRVIYVESPQQALPVAQRKDGEQPWMEAPPGEDPLVTADRFGRPVAILRIGGRVPSDAMAGSTASHGVPRVIMYDASDVCPLDVGTPSVEGVSDADDTPYLIEPESAFDMPPTDEIEGPALGL